jgi:hypothetical protein
VRRRCRGAAKCGRRAQATRFVVFYNPMRFHLWFALIFVIGLCFICLTIILRGARQESKLRRRKASVRKWVQSETLGRVRSASAGGHSG